MKPFIHDLPESRVLIEQIAQSRQIRSQLVDKDYWIMHALWGLQEQGFDFELKGGTSLSKGFQIIDRFSEDIDIRIEPPVALNVLSGKNHDKPSQIEGRFAFYDWLTKEISIPGFTTERDHTFDDKKGRNGGIRLVFQSAYEGLDGIKSHILLEVGFDLTKPNEKMTISSWLYDAALQAGIEISDNRAVDVRCYLPGYTFVEKLSAISAKYRQEQEGKLMPVNFIRHYYDIYQLLAHPSVLEFIGTEAYHEHKALRFREGDELDLRKNEAFHLSDPATRAKYAQEFKRTQVLYYGGFPSFELILERLRGNIVRL